ncbi:MAG: cardiolipin synthase [Methylotenera sp.]|uniref:cardiolipin synthase n=1 Tax=Methylotenera sp. TaxID=2051956 RepID=UPI002488FEB8|nr:cardiolipin synthase [Methylotenera sp.]MDI1308843.1 cardiolipin synthase [Methylotenera sp.]
MTILITIILTTLVVLVGMNFFTGEKRIEKKLEQSYEINDEQFLRSMSVLLGPPFLEGNEVKTLNNGDEIFAAMIQAIKGAEKTITFETFIYWNDSIGIEFAEALSERARAGVKVHVLLDWLGSVKMEEKQLDQMRRAGVEIQRYHKPHWSHLPRLNNRTHRKILVIDGKLGFTGGVGIADQWRGDARNPEEWRDSHFQITGPAVAQLQAVFMDNWIKAQGRVLHGELYFPALKSTGQLKAQVFSSSPTGGSDSMQLMYMMSITAAKQSIDISSAYFVPDELTMTTLISAAKRGVKIRIITPGKHIDTETVRKASRADWGKLLEAGIRIAEYEPTMYHCKIFIADNLLVSVGSTNFDNRSFRLNDEANLNIYDSKFASEQAEIFNEDWSHSHLITYQEWANRPLTDKAMENLAAILKTQL